MTVPLNMSCKNITLLMVHGLMSLTPQLSIATVNFPASAGTPSFPATGNPSMPPVLLASAVGGFDKNTSLITSFSTTTSLMTSLITTFSTGTSLITSLITSFSTTMGSAAVPPQDTVIARTNRSGIDTRILGWNKW